MTCCFCSLGQIAQAGKSGLQCCPADAKSLPLRLQVLWGECISGALYCNDFIKIARSVGFDYPILLQQAPIAVNDPGMRALLGNAQFFSITYRLFKLPGFLEPQCEDYGQVAIYKVSGLPTWNMAASCAGIAPA